MRESMIMRSPFVVLVITLLGACGTMSTPPATDCHTPTVTSTLPGVHFDLSGNRCSYSLSEAAAGVQFVYRVVVDASVTDATTTPASQASCAGPDASGLIVEPTVGGGGQSYCMCDCGLGLGASATATLLPGTYVGHFAWDGTNWTGPSDFGNPHGPAFPAGSYQFQVRVDGTAPAPGGSAPFTMTGLVQFDLTP
jgi:hypothetical protein